MSKKTLCDRCGKILELWRAEGVSKLIINLWSNNKKHQYNQFTYDLCNDCKEEFGKFMDNENEDNE